MEKSFYRRFGLAILPVVVICMPFIVMGAYTGARSNRNVVADWLPAHFEETRRLEWFNDRFGTAEMLAVSWDACTLDNHSVRDLAEALRELEFPGDEAGKLFDNVFAGAEMLDSLSDEPFNLSHKQAVSRMRGWLVGPDGHTCVVAQLSKLGENHRHVAVDRVLELAQEKCGVKKDAIRVAGPSFGSVAIDRTSGETIQPLNFLCWSI